jgi:UDP-2,4-diacetamido-2,4,6-trideoxy-beta-L-altropyranose hydrolase
MVMRVAIRTDASLAIGSGHVMRCLTLASALRAVGADCFFLCRSHEGHLCEYIRHSGFEVYELVSSNPAVGESSLAHAAWLGTNQIEDARECLPAILQLRPDWIVVDHYGLDVVWEREVVVNARCLVIDDLADRHHACDLLLDQNLGRRTADYGCLVPKHCHVLIGPQYALLRPEFAHHRYVSLQNRSKGCLGRLLVSMGGVDKDNYTGIVLQALATCGLPADFEITVIMGAHAPHLYDIWQQARQLPLHIDVKVGVSDMAELMSYTDFAIGAAGGTAWERCCLGLPTILMILAENQRSGAEALAKAGAAILVNAAPSNEAMLVSLQSGVERLVDPQLRLGMSRCASTITDGRGANRVVAEMTV